MHSIGKQENPLNTLRNISSSTVPTGTIAAGDLLWSDQACRVTAAGVPVVLRPAEFRLLGQLMTHAGRVQSRPELLEKIGNTFVGERTIDVHIRRLRMSLQPFGMDRWIQTAPARGYRFLPLN